MENEELTPEEKARRVEEFFAKKRAQNAGEEAVPGEEEMGSVAAAGVKGAIEGAAKGALKGAGRNAVKFAQAVVHEGSNVLKAAGFVPQLLGWDGLHLVADEMNEVAKGWGEAAALDYGYEDWGTKTGDAFGLLDSISGSLLTMRTLKTGGPNAMATVMGGSAAADTLSNARKSGHGFLRTAAEVGWNGGLNYFLGKLFANQTIEKLFKIPEMQGPMAERLTKEGIGNGVKGFESLVKAVRNGSVSEILLKRAVGALKAGGIMGVQSFVTALGDQYAKEDVKPVEEMSDEELRAAKAQIDAWDAEQAAAQAEGRSPDRDLKPEWEKDVWDRLAVAFKAGLHGAGEGALMEGVMGAGELALSMKEAREQTAAAVRQLIATPKGRAFMAAQNADAMGIVEGVAREGGTPTKAQLDAAGLPPDMPMREVRRLAFELKRDGEEAERRAEMETEEYKKRAELAERLAGELEEGKELEFETEEQKAEAERALQEREERIAEARADEMVARGQGMADTLFGEEAGVLVRRGTAEERRAAAEGAVGKGADARTLKDAEGQVYGYWDRGRNEVVLFGNADAKSVAHELGWHATRQWAEKNSPELLAKMNAYAQSCPAELRAKIEAAYPDFAKNPDALLDEIGAGRFEKEMGAKFGEMLERSPEAKSWWQGLKDMIAEAWRGMVRAIAPGRAGESGRGIDLKALEAMTPEKGMEWLVGEMAKGKRLGGGEAAKNAKGAEAQSVEVRYSRRKFEDGTEFVHVDVDQKKFDGKTPEEQATLAKKTIKDRFQGKVIGEGENAVFVNGHSAHEYAYAAKHIFGEEHEAKMRTSPELDTLMKTSRKAEDANDDGRHENAKGGWVYYDALFEVGGRYYSGRVSAQVNEKRQRLFHDVTKIKRESGNGLTKLHGNPIKEEPANQAAGATEDGHAALTGEQSRTVLRSPAPGKGSSVGANYSTGGSEKQVRPSIRGIFTGTAADYANRSREGGKDDGPSLKHIGTGEGSQVYGWGLYGSTVRGVAEGYASIGNTFEVRRNGKRVEIGNDGTAWHLGRFSNFNNPVSAALKDARERLRRGEDPDFYKKVIKELKTGEYSVFTGHENVYEQTFFTDRAPGDESHLLKWYEPVTSEQREWVVDRFRAEYHLETTGEDSHLDKSKNVEAARIKHEVENCKTGHELYKWIAKELEVEGQGGEKAASEFLARAGIDGVKYPVDSYGGKTLKDGDEAGWNYVSFRDDNIRVDHKWTDGQIRYSRKLKPEIVEQVTADEKKATRRGAEEALKALAKKPLKNLQTGIEAQINAVQRNKILSNAATNKSIRNGYTRQEHNAAAAIIEKLWRYAEQVEMRPDRDGDANIRTIGRFIAPVIFTERDANAYITVKETKIAGHRIYSLELEKLEAPGKNPDASTPTLKGQDGLSSSAAGDTSKELGAGEVPANSKDGADYSTSGSEKQVRPSIRGIFTGTAADYANRSREGGKDDGPSLKKIGTGEGSQVYGWGLYGSNVRGVAEGYAESNRSKLNIERERNEIFIDGKKQPWTRTPEGAAAQAFDEAEGDRGKAIANLREGVERMQGWLSSGKIRGERITELYRRNIANDQSAIKLLEDESLKFTRKVNSPTPKTNLYEQTFFTDRAPGDESHLLKWYEPVTSEQREWMAENAQTAFDEWVHGDGYSQDYHEASRRANQTEKMAREFKEWIHGNEEFTGLEIYEKLTEMLGSPKAASEALVWMDIDGVKYPVDSYGGKTLKDGDEAGWNYVSFRDDNIRVDHKWTDGQIRYSRKLKPTGLGDGKQKYYEVKFGDAVDRIVNNRRKGRDKAKAISDDMVFVSETPESLAQIGFVKLPVMMTQHHVETCYFNETEGKAWGMKGNMHGLKRTLKQLPEALKKPIMVIASESPKGGGTSVVAITRLTDADGHTVIAPVMLNTEMNAGGTRIDAHLAASVFGKKNAWTKLVENAIDAEANGATGIYSVDAAELAKVSPAMAKKYSTVMGYKAPITKHAQSVEVLHKIADPGSKVKGQAEKISGQTDTRQFKNFFGDWENDPSNASKVVDGEGKPLVVYRGAPFDPLAQEPGKGVIKPEAYFTADPEYAKRYTGNGGQVRAYYLNIRNPFDIRRPECMADLKKVYPDQKFQRGKSGALDWAEASTIDGEFLKENFGDKYDGIIYDEGGDPTEGGATHRGVSYVPLKGGAQVKSATDNIGTFDPENPDIRYQRRTAEEEIGRTERALKAVREGRVRIADSGEAAGEASEPGRAASEELLAAENAAPSEDRSVSNPVALPMSGMVGLYRALRSNPALPKVLIEAKRKGAAWVSRLTKGSDVELNPEAFGIIDDTVREEVKAEMKAEGLFRNEDPVWNMKHSKQQCENERTMSELRLEDRLNTLAQDITAGRKPGGNRVAANALAHEIGQLIMAMPMSEGLRKAAGKEGAAALKDFKALGEGLTKALEREWKAVKGDLDDPALIGSHLLDAAEAAAWWRGEIRSDAEIEQIAKEKGEEGLKAATEEENRAKAALAKNPKELAGELFGMFLAAPEALRERAPAAFKRIVEAITGNEALASAYARIANADAPTEVMAKIREQWTHEAQVELRSLEKELDKPLGTWLQRVKRRAILNLHSKEGPSVSIIDDALRERVAAAKRAVKLAKKGGDKETIAKAEANLAAVWDDAYGKFIDLKMGILKKQRGGGMERDYALNVTNRVMGDIARDGVELEDLRTYMKAKWCIALQGRADSFGMSPQEANKVIEGLKARLGDADFARLERAQRRFGEERRKAILENPDVAAAFGPALVDAWKKNADYVRSERILSAQQVKEYKAARDEWLKKNPGQADVLGDIELMVEMHRVRHGGSDGSVFAKPLEGSFKATGDPLAYTLMHDMHILQFARRNALVMQIADVAKELKVEGFKEVSDANLGRALEGSKRYGSVAFMRGGERKLLIMPKVAAEGFKAMGEGDVAGLVKANRMVSAVLTQYSPRFAWRNMFRNRQAVENNIPWMKESKLQTASRYFALGPVARIAEHLMERAVVRLPDSVVRNRAMSLVWGENTTMYWMGEATRIAKLMFDPKGIRTLAERADEAAANGDMAAAQAIMEDIAKARDMMKKPIFAGQWRMMMGQADRTDLDAVFAALDVRTDFTGEKYSGLRRAARAAKDLADTVRRFNTFEEARIKIVAELAAERARNNAAAEGEEFRYSQKEVDYMTATMAGSPRYEMRGRWMNVLEAIPFGPFANVGMKGAWRTVESMKTDPKAWWGKAAHRIAGRMAEIALWGAGGYALVAAMARRMFGDNEKAQKAIDGFESFGRRMARARACISDYRLRNYDIVPLGLYGKWCSFGINMPRGDEDRLIMPLTDTVARYLMKGDAAKRAGLHDPIDGAYTPVEAGVATLMDSGLAPDIYRGSMIWNLGKDTLYAWLQNPYNTFTKRNAYGQAVWENRFGSWSGAKDFFVETMKQAWNDVGGQVVVPATTWDEDAGDVPDEGRWVLGMADPKDAAEMPVGGKTIFRALHYVPMVSSMLSGMFYMNCDGDVRIARRLEKMQAKEKAARDNVAMRCVKMMLDVKSVSADYASMLDAAIKENGWDSRDRALIEQAIALKVKAAARKLGRESVPILDVFNKINLSDRERKEMERYLTGIGWEVE